MQQDGKFQLHTGVRLVNRLIHNFSLLFDLNCDWWMQFSLKCGIYYNTISPAVSHDSTTSLHPAKQEKKMQMCQEFSAVLQICWRAFYEFTISSCSFTSLFLANWRQLQLNVGAKNSQSAVRFSHAWGDFFFTAFFSTTTFASSCCETVQLSLALDIQQYHLMIAKTYICSLSLVPMEIRI